MFRSRYWLLVPLFAASTLTPTFASGSYSTGRPPKAKSGMASAQLDREKYGLGQKIYDGKVDLMAQGDMAAQEGRLKAIQSRLPASDATKKDLVSLAGKLTAEQLDALEYFVDRRFPMKK